MTQPQRTSGVSSPVAEHEILRVILIGSDLTGKTTLAEKLRAHYGVSGIGRRRIENDLEAIQEVVRFTLEDIPNKNFVLDQWQFPVDIVYQRVLGGGKGSPIEGIAPYIQKAVREHGVLFLHLTACDDVLHERFKVRGDELWDIEQILHVSACYREYVRDAKVFNTYAIRTIDTSIFGPDLVAEIAIAIINNFYSGKVLAANE